MGGTVGIRGLGDGGGFAMSFCWRGMVWGWCRGGGRGRGEGLVWRGCSPFFFFGCEFEGGGLEMGLWVCEIGLLRGGEGGEGVVIRLYVEESYVY